MKLFVLDEREIWHKAIIEAATNHGYEAKRIFYGWEANESGVGFIRPHADPIRLVANKDDYTLMLLKLKMIQDWPQMEVYEDKSAQFWRWGEWMPPTWRFERLEEARGFLKTAQYPIVSKADVGASSVNVRILKDLRQADEHVRQIFTVGIPVNHCADTKTRGRQKDYVLFQQFIPHAVTWRVNAIGRTRAVFKRYCYKDKPVAQTGNVEPVMEMTEEIESLLEYSNKFFATAGTQWCAIDILKHGSQWKLLESSLAWPWPSPGRCMEAPLFGSNRKWAEMFEVMMDEVVSGVWG
jgi:biotin carboxylase